MGCRLEPWALPAIVQIFKGVASGKQSFREHCATKWLLEANPRNISASKISRYTVYTVVL